MMQQGGIFSRMSLNAEIIQEFIEIIKTSFAIGA
jgi:hypothetical protein